MPTRARCPRCSSDVTIPIVYGLPGPELFEAADRGDVVLAGCIVGDADPSWACAACGHHFGVYRWDEHQSDRHEFLAERRARFDVLTPAEQERCLRFSEWDSDTQQNLLRWARWDTAEWASAVADEIREGLYDDGLEEIARAIAERQRGS